MPDPMKAVLKPKPKGRKYAAGKAAKPFPKRGAGGSAGGKRGSRKK
jgi:hypothetical protein